jgi:hypothetical protein
MTAIRRHWYPLNQSFYQGEGFMPCKVFFLIVFLSIFSIPALATFYTHEGYMIKDPGREYLPLLKAMKDYTIDIPNSKGYELWGPRGLKKWLRQNSIPFQELPRPPKFDFVFGNYQTPEALGQKLKVLTEKYPQILTLESIGKSVQGRDLWAIKITGPQNKDLALPEVKLIANMHGDEIVGRELMAQLIEEMAQSYNHDPFITELVNNTEIYILPSMNPDGMARRQRGNANWVDLNRDFPDFTEDPNNTPDGRALETQLVMNFQKLHHFALSANFHGGAVCVNYPWDTTSAPPPQEKMIQDISLSYASQNPEMHSSTEFPGGITNGYAWYEVNGGMQDWSYFWYQDLQLTVELSEIKWPSPDTIENFYRDNRNSLLNFLAQVHRGAGFKFKTPVSGKVSILNTKQSENLGAYDFSDGEFYKVLEVGNYEFVVQANDSDKNYHFNISVEPEKIYPGGNFKLLE